jgi:DNA transformation protein
MGVSSEFTDYALEQLNAVRPVRAKRMFGGLGLYAGDWFFALVKNNTLYFKVDNSNRKDFEQAGMPPFMPFGPEGWTMNYYEVPTDVLEDLDELKQWIDKAVSVARRSPVRKPKRPRTTKP